MGTVNSKRRFWAETKARQFRDSWLGRALFSPCTSKIFLSENANRIHPFCANKSVISQESQCLDDSSTCTFRSSSCTSFKSSTDRMLVVGQVSLQLYVCKTLQIFTFCLQKYLVTLAVCVFTFSHVALILLNTSSRLPTRHCDGVHLRKISRSFLVLPAALCCLVHS